MSKRIYIVALLMVICCTTNAQIVNVESLRKVADTSGWSGFVSLDLSLIKNRRDIFKIANRTHVQYSAGKHLLLFINDLNIQQLDDEKFVNRGIQHLRYNYKFHPRIAWEAFVQTQFDPVSNINIRALAGTGTRFKVLPSKKHRFYLGTLLMYEYEETEEMEMEVINSDIRGSMYVSVNLYPSDNISIISTSYYQPRVDAIRDYRISNETSIVFTIFKDLRFKSTFTLLFDSFPAMDIPDTQYEWTNGLAYTFH